MRQTGSAFTIFLLFSLSLSPPTHHFFLDPGRKFESCCDETEPWYGTRYGVSRIPESTLTAWREAGLHDALRLPDVNEFIPTNFELVKPECDEDKLPVVVAESPYGRIW